MSKVTFKFQPGVKAQCRITGLKGIITSRLQMINGCVQYAIQPPIKSEESSYIPDAWNLDENNIELMDGVQPVSSTHDFKFETGDKVTHRINGAEGIITCRLVDMNGCERYRFEAKLDKDGKEVSYGAFAQELQLIDNGLNAPDEKPIERKRTGGPSTRAVGIQKAF